MTHVTEPPERSTTDNTLAVGRIGLSLIPLVGGPAVELLNALVTPPLEKRRLEWQKEVGEALFRLESEKRISLEDLQNDDSFVDAVLQSTRIALANSESEKLLALKNALLNSALPNPPDASIRCMFLNYVDEFTVWHLKILGLFDNPVGWYQKQDRQFSQSMVGGLTVVLEDAYAELKDRRDFYDQVWKDLHNRGLVGTPSLGGMMTGRGLTESRTTEWGKQFIQFIDSPV